MEKIGFGGGCHWCTEAVFQAVRGICGVEQGFIRSDPPDDAFCEAVVVEFDPAAIDLAQLVEIHLATHASTADHTRRTKYRSAVYVFGDAQAAAARAALLDLQRGFDKPLVTRILPFRAFKPSDDRFRNYYASDPARPFCRTYIDPKLAKLAAAFGDVVVKSE